MKMTNLYNFETSLPLTLGIVNRLPNGPRMLVQPEEQKEGKFRIDPGLYDAAKQNEPYRDLVKSLDFHLLTLEELKGMWTNDSGSPANISRRLLRSRNDGWNSLYVKLRYLLIKINLYWPSQVDKVEILQKRFFLSWSLAKISIRFWVPQWLLKALISDYRRVLRLLKNNLKRGSKKRILRPEHLTFIEKFLSEN